MSIAEEGPFDISGAPGRAVSGSNKMSTMRGDNESVIAGDDGQGVGVTPQVRLLPLRRPNLLIS
jgi:hypothetical protein